MPAAKAGARDQRIMFQTQSRAGDGGGGSVTTWVDVGPATWAGFEAMPVRNPEILSGQQLDARTYYRVTLPNRRDIIAEMRIKWLSNGSQILSIRDCADPGQQAIDRTIQAELAGPESQ